MNINDLRNKIMPLITNNCREAIIKVAYDAFSEYECQQSNKIDESLSDKIEDALKDKYEQKATFFDYEQCKVIYSGLHKIFNEKYMKEIEVMKEDICELDERIDNRGDSLDKKIDLLEKEIETLKKMLSDLGEVKANIKPVSETKQERFYIHKNEVMNYEIRKLIYNTHTVVAVFYILKDAMIVCDYLNSMEASKNE